MGKQLIRLRLQKPPTRTRHQGRQAAMVPCGLPENETTLRENRGIKHRLKNARLPVRFPVIKTLGKSRWSWPRKINRSQIHNLFRLAFIRNPHRRRPDRGRGKTPLSIALGHAACLKPLTCEEDGLSYCARFS